MIPVIFKIALLIQFPNDLYDWLEQQARVQQRPVEEVVQDYIVKKITTQNKIKVVEAPEKGRDGTIDRDTC